ncbi:hypothetical protein PC121_g17811 [Phytophthora cactorum]|nr:hypothetical protein PC121_g17811 [Phytophthora cactorum]
MANLAQQLARLQLGASGGRHRPSKRPDDVPPISSNNSSISLQHSSIQRSLLASLHCPAQRVLALGDGPEAPINGQTTGYMPSGPIFQVAYAHTKNLLVAVDEEGVVGVVNVAAGRRKSRWMAHHNAVFDVIWTQDDTQVLTAAGDLEIRIWDVETTGTNSATPVSTLRGHDMSVKCVRQAPDNAHVFASGGRDGRVLLWDTRATGKPVSSLENVHAEPTPSRISSPNVSFTTPTQKRRRRGAAASSSSPSPRSVTCVEFSSSGSEIITADLVFESRGSSSWYFIVNPPSERVWSTRLERFSAAQGTKRARSTAKLRLVLKETSLPAHLQTILSSAMLRVERPYKRGRW